MTIYLSFSGGMDSTALLARAVADSSDVVAVSFRYGQRHVREVRSATAIAAQYGVRRAVVDLPHLSSPSLTGDQPVPHGHYAAESMKATVVQGRNLLFIAALVGMAQPGDEVWVGVHAGDHAVYGDCRPAFIYPLQDALRAAYGVELVVPYIDTDKAGIARDGAAHEAPLGLSWSCYEGGDVHCGRCGTCVERAEAFHLAGLPDPTVYADAEFWREAVGL